MTKSKKDQRTLVTFLLDRSQSMDSVKPQTIEAFNEYLEGLQKAKTPIDFTFLQFDTQSLDKICVAEPVKNVKPLTPQTFQPRASTPLIDSAYATIKAVEKQEKAKGAKIVICFQTDGQENSSTKYKWEDLKALIKEKTALGWQFNFMGCGIDAYAQGAMMGVAVGSTVSYGQDRRSTRAVFGAMASNTANYASGLSATMDFLDSQKAASGDKFFKPDANLNLDSTNPDDLSL